MNKNRTWFNFCCIFSLVVGSLTALGQYEDPGANQAAQPHPNRAVGDVIGTFTPGFAGTLPVGLDAQAGGGGFLGTEIGNDDWGFMTTTGTVNPVFSTTDNPLGITTDGTTIYITNSVLNEVLMFDNAGNPTGSFSVAAIGTFPEGIAYNTGNGNLYVVDGSGGNQVGEFTTAGALVNTFPINGSSQDGIAYDNGTFWVYDSGTDSVTQYDTSFNFIQAFSGPANAGFGNGEGLAVLDSAVWVVATGSNTVVGFEIFQPTVPTLSNIGMIVMVSLLVIGGLVVMRRRKAATA